MIPQIRTSDYNYDLPQDKIAQHPLEERDASKLLIYRNDECIEDIYRNVSNYLPANSLMIFNNSKVIPARILFVKETSGVIELFCLEPIEGTPYQALQQQGKSTWTCLVGGLKKWKTQSDLQWTLNSGNNCIVSAKFQGANENGFQIEFSWTDSNLTFVEVLSQLGQMPIPPYMLRKAELEDSQRYQTVYATVEGSVAAPTAGLHITQRIIEELADKNIVKAEVTLHVGAGTFKPVTSEHAHEHNMHSEWVEVSIELIKLLLLNDNIICVGTTSLRSIESLFWFVFLSVQQGKLLQEDFVLPQFIAYENEVEVKEIVRKILLQDFLDLMESNSVQNIMFKTELMILPGYKMKMATHLLTNFHQPQSTLLMLVDAFTKGEWKKVYIYALTHDYRFLSYGDACLFEYV